MPQLRHTKSEFFQTKSKFKIPDLVADCPFPLHRNPNEHNAGDQSDAWIYSQGGLSAKKLISLRNLKCGMLTAMTYPFCPENELRVCCDFLSFLFHLDDLSDDMDKRGTRGMREMVMGSIRYPTFEASAKVGRMARDIWTRFALSASLGAKLRFIKTFDQFFQALEQQALDRKEGKVIDLDAYTEQRRDSSGCRPCWVLIEYANGLDLPEYVMNEKEMMIMNDATNDLVSWSNDIFSYKKEGVREDTHNMIPIVMRDRKLNLQEAVDFVGDACNWSIRRFCIARESMPRYDHGGHIDRQVQQYIRGLEDWMVGSLHWSFESGRYFGKEGKGIKKSRIVKIVPEGDVELPSLWNRILCTTVGSASIFDST